MDYPVLRPVDKDYWDLMTYTLMCADGCHWVLANSLAARWGTFGVNLFIKGVKR